MKVEPKEATIYRCDPAKNTSCIKTMCYLNDGPCHYTVHKEFAKDEDDEDKAN